MEDGAQSPPRGTSTAHAAIADGDFIPREVSDPPKGSFATANNQGALPTYFAAQYCLSGDGAHGAYRPVDSDVRPNPRFPHATQDLLGNLTEMLLYCFIGRVRVCRDHDFISHNAPLCTTMERNTSCARFTHRAQAPKPTAFSRELRRRLELDQSEYDKARPSPHADRFSGMRILLTCGGAILTPRKSPRCRKLHDETSLSIVR